MSQLSNDLEQPSFANRTFGTCSRSALRAGCAMPTARARRNPQKKIKIFVKFFSEIPIVKMDMFVQIYKI